MDINDLRSAVTVISFLTFVGLIVWAISKRNRDRFDEAANLPFDYEETPSTTNKIEEVK